MKNKNALEFANFTMSSDCDALDFSHAGYMRFKGIAGELEKFRESLEEARKKFTKPSDEFAKSQEEKKQIVKPFVVCGKDGEPVTGQGGNVTPLDGMEEDLRAAVEPFNAEQKHLQDEYNNQIAAWNDFFVNGEADLVFEPLTGDDLEIPANAKRPLFRMLEILIPEKFEV